jgi:NitT/TauT family transport system ATP-binding protein
VVGPSQGALQETDPLPAVRGHKICKQFGAERVLDNVDFELPSGSFTSIVGPSGCGKTTLLRIIAGIESADSGSLDLNSKPGADGVPALAVVFQQGSLLPWKSVRRNVAFGLELAKLDRSLVRDRVARALDLVHLTGSEDKYPHQLSGGMQQRVGIARALALDPAILLMDEPFASVDAQTREELHDELLAIWERSRKSVLFVTHSIDEAIVLSDQIIVMGARPGRVLTRLPVHLPRPRTEQSAHLMPGYGELRHQIRSLLTHTANSPVEGGDAANGAVDYTRGH